MMMTMKICQSPEKKVSYHCNSMFCNNILYLFCLKYSF